MLLFFEKTHEKKYLNKYHNCVEYCLLPIVFNVSQKTLPFFPLKLFYYMTPFYIMTVFRVAIVIIQYISISYNIKQSPYHSEFVSLIFRGMSIEKGSLKTFKK